MYKKTGKIKYTDNLLELKTNYSYATEAFTDILFRSAKRLSPCLDSLL